MAEQEYHYPQTSVMADSEAIRILRPVCIAQSKIFSSAAYCAAGAADHPGEPAEVLYAHRVNIGNVPDKRYKIINVRIMREKSSHNTDI